MYPLGMCLNPARRGVIATMVVARWIVLHVGAAVMVIDDGKQDVIHPEPEIFISKATGLLLLAVEVGEQEVQRHVFKPDGPAECVMRDFMYRAVDLMLLPGSVEVVNPSRGKMKIRLEIRHRHFA
jgi:hypothetical protein